MSTRAPTAPATRGPVPLWHDHTEIIQIVFVRALWGVLRVRYSLAHVLEYSLDSLTIYSLTEHSLVGHSLVGHSLSEHSLTGHYSLSTH